jgi:hypothetical protein
LRRNGAARALRRQGPPGGGHLRLAAERIEWQAAASDLEASLTEIELIQALRPRRNVAGAFPFLYPYIGIQVDGPHTRFCLTTSPEAFTGFELHGEAAEVAKSGDLRGPSRLTISP